MDNTTNNMEQPENINDQTRHPEAEHFIFGQHLCKGFNTSESRIEILREVEFHVDAGETIAIVGASGIGKSTSGWSKSTPGSGSRSVGAANSGSISPVGSGAGSGS